ncbi:MAG TPA: lysylphosphatidylglycerol synthase domain-containing protein [Bacteroidota bacterium]|nr:lysylphosphatidylglycerol synthase domain-containing protein [Bacteroidota bacterium]
MHFQFDWAFVLLPVPFLAGMLIDTLIWKQFLLRRIQISFASLFAAHAGAEAVLLSVPGGFALADPLKVAWLHKRFRIVPSDVIAGLVVRHWLLGITQVLYVLVVSGIGLIVIQSHAVASYLQISSMAFGIAASLSIGLLLVFSIWAFLRGELARMFWKWLYRIPLPALRRWLKRQYHAFIETDRQFRLMGKEPALSVAAMVLLYCVFWAVEAFETLLVAHVLGFSIGTVEALLMEAWLSLVKLGVFFLPAGAGAKEAGYVALFAALGIPVGGTLLAGFVILKRIVSLGFIALGYGFLSMQGISPFLKRPQSWNTITER